MDKPLNPKPKTFKKLLLFSVPFLFLLSLMILNFTKKKQVNLKKDRLSIKEVFQGDFEDIVLLNSTVEPKTSVFINIIQGGSVSEIFVESGIVLKKGTPLLRIYNPNAELSYLTQETAMIEQINNLRNIRVSIKNQQLNLDEQLLSIDNAFKNAKRQFKVDSTLYKKDILARNDYQKTAQEYQFQTERKKVIRTSAFNEKNERKEQLSRINTSLNNMLKSLELLRKNKENFIVKAPKNGQLSSFNPILGQNYNQGESVGKLDLLDGYKLVANVDEYYNSKLSKGIKGSVTIENKVYNITLTKIFQEIINGQFKVELMFENKQIPSNIKRGMSVKTKLFLSSNKQALMISKGLFYQSTNGQWVFVLNSDNKAVKKRIKIGRENPFYYEIIEGLDVGDKVITSNYDDFITVEEINLE
jgi:HlyD family secretion protein